MLSVWSDTDLDITRQRSLYISTSNISTSSLHISNTRTSIRLHAVNQREPPEGSAMKKHFPFPLWWVGCALSSGVGGIWTCVWLCKSVCYLNNKWQKLLLSCPDICQSFLLLGIVLLWERVWLAPPVLHRQHTGNIII